MANIKSVYGCYRNNDGNILIIKDANSNKWGFPGGNVEPGENQESALAREFIEETGLTINKKPICFKEQKSVNKDRLFFKISSVSGELLPTGNTIDVSNAGYYSIFQMNTMDLADGVMELTNIF